MCELKKKMVIKPADFFEYNRLPSIADSVKLIGLFDFFEEFFPILIEEKLEISIFLGALELYLRNQDFGDEVAGKIQEACAEVVKIERKRKDEEAE